MREKEIELLAVIRLHTGLFLVASPKVGMHIKCTDMITLTLNADLMYLTHILHM